MKLKGVAYYPSNTKLELPYVEADSTGRIDPLVLESIDPIQYPVLKPYVVNTKMMQIVVLKDALYQELMGISGKVVEPVLSHIEVPNDKLIHLAITMSKNCTGVVDWEMLEAWMENPQLEIDLTETATILLFAFYSPERVLNATRKYLDQLVGQYGAQGLCKLLDYNCIPYQRVNASKETFKRLCVQEPHIRADTQVFTVFPLELPYCSYIPIDKDGYCQVNAIEYVTHLIFKCKRAIVCGYTNYYKSQILNGSTDEDLYSRMQRFNQLRYHYLGVENRIKRQKFAVEDSALLDIEDLGELRHRTAPCVLNMLQSERRAFPSNEIRKKLVATMHKGKLSFATVDRWFQSMFQKDSGGYRKLENRFDHKYYYDKGYGAPRCEKMAKWCPFQSKMAPFQLDKSACFATFKTRNLEHVHWAAAHNLYGPSQWYSWIKK